VSGETGAAAGQAPAGAQPQAGTQPSGQAPQGTQAGQAPGEPNEPGTETITDPAVLAQQLNEVRREAAANRVKLQALEREKAAAEAAKLSDVERKDREITELKAEAANLRNELQEQRVQTAVTEAASRLGFRNPALAYSLLDRSELVGEDGKVKGVEPALRKLLQAEPYLGTGAPVDYGGGQRGKPASDGKPSMNDALRALAKGGSTG
jgi:hypothetical protein